MLIAFINDCNTAIKSCALDPFHVQCPCEDSIETNTDLLPHLAILDPWRFEDVIDINNTTTDTAGHLLLIITTDSHDHSTWIHMIDSRNVKEESCSWRIAGRISGCISNISQLIPTDHSTSHRRTVPQLGSRRSKCFWLSECSSVQYRITKLPTSTEYSAIESIDETC